jgi:hypothetical protein
MRAVGILVKLIQAPLICSFLVPIERGVVQAHHHTLGFEMLIE